MPRLKHLVPRLRRHKASGQAIVTLNGRDHYLGPWPSGKRKAPLETKEAYDRLLAEWLASGRRLPVPPRDQPTGTSIAALAVAFSNYAKEHYRRADGTLTSEVNQYKMALRPLVHLYGSTTADDFGPLALKAVRQLMVGGYQHPKYGPQPSLSRGVVNQRAERIRRVFKWGVENEMVAPPILHGLQSVRGLQRGRTSARETEPIHPVAVGAVEEAIPFLNRHLAAMVRLQLLTGMRPGEACVMRACDLDLSGPVWLYRPGSDQGSDGQHKTAHQGHQRVIPLGPKAQQVIRPFLKLDNSAYLFSPRDAEAERKAALRHTRKTRVQPSQQNRRKKKPARAPGGRYTTSSYQHAVRAACDAAFPPPVKLGPRMQKNGKREGRSTWLARLTADERAELRRWRKERHWHPHQLRHTYATEVRRRYGLEAAQVALGHSQANVTELYAERNLGLAIRVAGEIG